MHNRKERCRLYDRLTENDVIKNGGTLMYGRVRQYSHKEGFGFIYTESGKDVFVSSYAIGKKNEKRFFVGTLVSFIPIMHENKVVASEITILKSFPRGEQYCMPNGEYIPVKRICKYGLVAGKQVLSLMNSSEKEMCEAGYTYFDLEYVYIRTTTGEYKFHNIGTKRKGDGQTDLVKFINELDDYFISVY